MASIPISGYSSFIFLEIRDLAQVLNLSDGGVLKLAREISHNGSLLSIRHMRRVDLQELKTFLERASVAMTVKREHGLILV